MYTINIHSIMVYGSELDQKLGSAWQVKDGADQTVESLSRDVFYSA